MPYGPLQRHCVRETTDAALTGSGIELCQHVHTPFVSPKLTFVVARVLCEDDSIRRGPNTGPNVQDRANIRGHDRAGGVLIVGGEVVIEVLFVNVFIRCASG
jgi:hypothetical protein